MSTLLLNTPDSSSRDSSMISTSALAQHNMISPNPKTPNNNNNVVGVSGTPPSPRASDSAIIVPRRIFVGGFPPATTEHELRSYFERFGSVRDVKIIRDHAATAKGKYSYGFVTFETDEEAKKLIAMGKAEGARAFEFRGRYLNVNEAVKKPPFNKLLPLDAVPPTGVVLRDINGQLFTIQNGYAIIASPDAYAIAQPQPPNATIPFVVQHPIYLAATAPPAPLKYAHQPAAAFTHMQPSPASAPVYPGSATHMPKTRFIFPPLPPVPQAPFNGNQVGHLPPTPVASPVNPESPSKNMMNFTGNNPAITNLTNPFPSIYGGNQQMPMPSSPYRWTTSTIAGPVTQLVYPGGYPTFVHDVNHPYPIQHHQHPGPPVGAGMLPGFYSPDVPIGDYTFSALEPSHELQTSGMDRRQSKNAYRMDTGATLKD